MRTLLLLIVVFFTTHLMAQKTEVELIRSALKVEKKAIVAEYLKLSDADAQKFWPVYAKYEEARFELGTRHITLIENYTKELENADHKAVEKLVKESAAIQKKAIDIRLKYYKAIKKEVSIVVAAKFYQIEDAIDIAVRNQMNNDMLKMAIISQQ